MVQYRIFLEFAGLVVGRYRQRRAQSRETTAARGQVRDEDFVMKRAYT
jgi:hypothetical protein